MTTAAVRVTVVPATIALAPGQSADVEVSIVNSSAVVEHFTAAVIGLPRQDLSACEPAMVMLRPKEQGTVRARITIPARMGPMAGRYVLGVLVTSPYQQQVSRCEELVLDVHPVPALTATARPEVAQGGATGEFGVTVANEGNLPLAVTLAGDDPENRVGFEFEPRQLRLAPGMSADARLLVRADPPLTGHEVRRTLTLHAHAGGLTVDKALTFAQRPRIAGGLLRTTGLLAAVALMAGATVGGAMLIRGAKQAVPTNPVNPVTHLIPSGIPSDVIHTPVATVTTASSALSRAPQPSSSAVSQPAAVPAQSPSSQ